MATVTTRFEIDRRKLDQLLFGRNSTLVAWLLNVVGQAVEQEQKLNAPLDKGKLRSDIRREIVNGGSAGFSIRVGNTKRVPYAKFVNTGTGLFGPRRAYIVAKGGGFMRFPARGGPKGPPIPGNRAFQSGGFVYTKMTRGQKSQPYIEQSLRAFHRVTR